VLSVLAALLGGCGDTKGDPKAEAPPQTKVEHEDDANIVQTEHPEQFPLATAVEHASASQLIATGTISPDVSRTVPVVSLAAGRVVEIRARLGDTVKKGQLLLRVQSADISGAFSDYRKAVADEQLARTQLDRSQLLYDKGAISLNDLQVSQDAEEKAKVDVENTTERLRVLGGDINHPAAIVDIVAPASGVITDQQVTAAAGTQGLSSPNPFTISDLSNVWILCDVYENDLPNVHVGETADIRLTAYPDKIFTGRISNVGPVLDPSLRTAKVRIEVHNPGLLRIGMFVTATFHAQKKETHAAVPSSAILHLHDRDWVYVPVGDKKFRRVEVVSGNVLPNGMQEVVSGIKPGQSVVTNALVLQNTVEE
jgi:cobalt-zinc-cadmium efflux system membrane fusion protein